MSVTGSLHISRLVVLLLVAAGLLNLVALSLAGLPAQASAPVTPAVVTGGTGTAHVAVATTATLAPGSYPLTVTATGGGVTRTAAAKLTVTTPGDFGIAVAPASVTVSRRATAAYTVSITAIGPFAGAVAL
jgi:hypothetical protein